MKRALGTLTATATVRGITATKERRRDRRPLAARPTTTGTRWCTSSRTPPDMPRRSISTCRAGDNPEQWDPLNGGSADPRLRPRNDRIRDPYLTYNPGDQTYYIIATDLRVFGGDAAGNCTRLVLLDQERAARSSTSGSRRTSSTWGDLRQIDMAADAGEQVASSEWRGPRKRPGSMTTTRTARGAFVVYWSSNMLLETTAPTRPRYYRMLWGATTDFSQERYSVRGRVRESGWQHDRHHDDPERRQDLPHDQGQLVR